MSTVLSFLYSLALVWCVGATLWRVSLYIRTPQPYNITLQPAAHTQRGVVLRMLFELVFFRALFRASFWTWLPSMLFHYGLLLILLMHLRFIFSSLPLWMLPLLIASFYAALATVAGLSMLLARRVINARVRFISAPSDYLHLVLLLAIVLSGMLMKRQWPTDLYAVGQFVQGIFTLSWQPLPDSPVLWVHLVLVLLLIVVFPISKLIHAPGIFFSPTLATRDTAKKLANQTNVAKSPHE